MACADVRSWVTNGLGAEVPRRPRLCENSDVELPRRNFVSITLNRKRTALAVAVEGGKGRKQFCAFSGRPRFHTASTHNGHRAYMRLRPIVLRFSLAARSQSARLLELSQSLFSGPHETARVH